MHHPVRPPLRAVAAAAALALALAALSGCGGSSDGASATSTTAASTTKAGGGTMQILVSNDDGYAAPGIDALVKGLQTLDDVDVVVAPAKNQSGTGGNETPGKVKVTDVETASGFPAKAVDGYPADAVRVAIDELKLHPDLVVTGINQGQNLGPLVDASGTVGAARAAVDRKVPALASSQGMGKKFDYEAAVPLILAWIRQNRADIQSGKLVPKVTNLNVPSCDAGKVRGLLQVEPDLGGDPGEALKAQDCTSTKPADSFTQDVPAFTNGFATISEVPSQPAS